MIISYEMMPWMNVDSMRESDFLFILLCKVARSNISFIFTVLYYHTSKWY